MGLDGRWYNELGSLMELRADGALIQGRYTTSVGASGTYQLRGGCDTSPRSESQSLGFVVVWNNDVQKNAHSVTTWSGQYQVIHGQEMLTTLWLLTSETEASQNWQATNVGEDVFTRTPPSEETKRRRLARGSLSHPMQ